MQRYRMAFCTLSDVVLQLNYDAASALSLSAGQQAIVDVESTNVKTRLKQLILDASDEIMNKWHRWFVPTIEAVTLYSDEYIFNKSISRYGTGFRILLDYLDYADLLSITSLSIDGSVVSSSYYRAYPSFSRPARGLSLDRLSVQAPLGNSFASAMTITGQWGYHENPSSMWSSIGTLQAGINSSVTSFVATADTVANFAIYQYLRIDSEFLFVTDVNSSTPYTITVQRGVNGSTAASHLIAASVDAYQIMPQVAEATRRHVIRLLRKSPEFADVALVGEGNVTLDPETIKLSLPIREVWGDV